MTPSVITDTAVPEPEPVPIPAPTPEPEPTPPPPPPHRPGLSINLIARVDSIINTVSRWSIRDASFLPTQSRLEDGSGSIALAGTTVVLGPSVQVTPGQQYTCGVYFQGDSIPTTLRLGLKVLGHKARNASGAKNWVHSVAGQWTLATFVLLGDHTVRLLISRPNAPNRYVQVRIDDAFCAASS